ncbi:MAG: hypothetical protein J7L66_06030 [Anaerolineaceae bacterium]|nr:hypothetical protein [Anaerolineaceae bacterium]
MKNKTTILLLLSVFLTSCSTYYENYNRRLTIPLEKEWYFIKSDIEGAEQPGLNENNWEIVRVPHD